MAEENENVVKFVEGERVWVKFAVASVDSDDLTYLLRPLSREEPGEEERLLPDWELGWFPEQHIWGDQDDDRPLVAGDYVTLRGERRLGLLVGIKKGIGWVDWDFTDPSSTALGTAAIGLLIRYHPDEEEMASFTNSLALNRQAQAAA